VIEAGPKFQRISALTAKKTPALQKAAAKKKAAPAAGTTKTAERKAKRAAKAAAPDDAKAPKTKKVATKKAAAGPRPFEALLKAVLTQLDDDKAEEVVSIDLEGRADYADVMVVASGRSARHVASIADHLAAKVKEVGFGRAIVEGEKTGDWAIIDCGDVVVHVFRPEVRAFYDLEAMWSAVAEQRAQS
jgi:ribosome-associated protein